MLQCAVCSSEAPDYAFASHCSVEEGPAVPGGGTSAESFLVLRWVVGGAPGEMEEQCVKNPACF